MELSEYGVGRGIPDAPLVEAIGFLNNRNNEIAIVKYVIMPDHVHLFVLVKDLRKGASRMPRPTCGNVPSMTIIRDDSEYLMGYQPAPKPGVKAVFDRKC